MTQRICPRCKSENIVQDASILTGQYHCKNCGYIGPIIVEKFNELKERK